MTKQHTKSPCCKAEIHCHGGRRRLCSSCHRTWSISSHKAGPKPKRHNYELLKRIVLHDQKLKDQKAHYSNLSVDAIRKRFEKTLERFVSQGIRFSKLKGSYILLADGLHFKFKKEEWVLYLCILKPRRRNKAYLLDPTMIKGAESFKRWKQAIDTIPENLRKRIVAFVSDDFRTSSKIAQHFGWLHQLCQFHLISALHRRRAKRKLTLKGRAIREEIYGTIRFLLATKDVKKIPFLTKKLLTLSQYPDCPKSLTMIVNEFLRKIASYRTYLEYSGLTIPRTTSPVESLGNLIRERTRSLNSPEAVFKWSTAFTRFKKRMICNGQSQRKIPQNYFLHPVYS